MSFDTILTKDNSVKTSLESHHCYYLSKLTRSWIIKKRNFHAVAKNSLIN